MSAEQVLAQHQWGTGACICGKMVCCHDDIAAHQIDALKAAGYAVVNLPEPDSERYEGDEHEPADRDSWMVDAYEVAVWYPGEVQINYYGSSGEPVNTAIARDLAGALLAAIDAAEAQS